jgi:hypothetical protein
MNHNPYPQGRWNSPAASDLANAPLRELFWNMPENSALLEEAEQRIMAALRRALAPEPMQLFDDLYEAPLV